MRKIDNRKRSTGSPQSDGFCAGKNYLKYKVLGWECGKKAISTSRIFLRMDTKQLGWLNKKIYHGMTMVT